MDELAMDELHNLEDRVAKRLDLEERVMTRLDTQDKLLNAIHDDIAVIQDVLNTFKSGMRILGWIGTAAKWFAAMVAGGAALWTFFHGGNSK